MLQSHTIRQYCNQLDSVDRIGFFTRVLLREFLELGRKMYPGFPQEDIQEETKDFLAFLEDIANRERGEEAELDFSGKKIHVGVVLVAKAEILAEWGTSAHKRRIGLKLKQNDAVYVCGLAETANAAEAVARRFRGAPEVRDVEIKRYEIVSRAGRNIPAVCCTLIPTKAGTR